MRLNKVLPRPITEGRGAFRGADDVGEQHGRQRTIEDDVVLRDDADETVDLLQDRGTPPVPMPPADVGPVVFLADESEAGVRDAISEHSADPRIDHALTTPETDDQRSSVDRRKGEAGV